MKTTDSIPLPKSLAEAELLIIRAIQGEAIDEDEVYQAGFMILGAHLVRYGGLTEDAVVEMFHRPHELRFALDSGQLEVTVDWENA